MRAVLQPARQHQVGQIAARHQQDATSNDEEQLQPLLILIPHRRYAGAAGNEMQRLLLPELFRAGIHIGNVTGQPIVQLDLEFCFESIAIGSGAHSADQVEEIAVWRLQPRRVAVDQGFLRGGQPEIGHSPSGQLGAVKARRSEADDRERMPVDLISGADHRSISAVFLLPDAVTHHGHRRCAFLIVRIIHEPADPRPHT